MWYTKSMPLAVFFEYLLWQYGDGIQEYMRAWKNIHWFLWCLFSVPLLLHTFFSPFRRTSEGYGRTFDPSVIAQTFLINLVTRLVGIIVRAVFLVIALLFETAVAAVGILLFFFFITAPAAVPGLLLTGIIFLFIALI